MAHHDRDSIVSNDLSARDEFAIPQGVTSFPLLSYLAIALQPSVRLVAAI